MLRPSSICRKSRSFWWRSISGCIGMGLWAQPLRGCCASAWMRDCFSSQPGAYRVIRFPAWRRILAVTLAIAATLLLSALALPLLVKLPIIACALLAYGVGAWFFLGESERTLVLTLGRTQPVPTN